MNIFLTKLLKSRATTPAAGEILTVRAYGGDTHLVTYKTYLRVLTDPTDFKGSYAVCGSQYWDTDGPVFSDSEKLLKNSDEFFTSTKMNRCTICWFKTRRKQKSSSR